MPTVLLIDDNQAVTEIIRALLQRNNYAVQVANSPSAAVNLLARERVDIIVSDVMMPETDGFQLGRQIRSNPETSKVPIIFLTALDSLEDEFEAWLSGADAFMVKPFKARDLLNSIEGVLAGKGRNLSSSNGRINAVGDKVRTLCAVSITLRRRLSEAAERAGLALEFSGNYDEALKRLDREKFGLLICDSGLPRFSVQSLADYMRYFALKLPALLIGADNDGRFPTVAASATAEQLAAAVRESLGR